MTENQLKKLEGKSISFSLPAFKHAVQINRFVGVVGIQEICLKNSTKLHYNMVLSDCFKNGAKCQHDIVIQWNRLAEIYSYKEVRSIYEEVVELTKKEGE